MPRHTNSAIAILGSPFPGSSSEKIVRLIFDKLSKSDWTTQIIDLSVLPSDALLLKTKDNRVDDAMEITVRSDLLIPATPTYRATYTGLLKVFLDQMPNNALKNTVVLPVQTGGSADHSLTIEHGLIPVVRSLGANVFTSSIYSWGIHWNEDGSPNDDLKKMISKSVKDADRLLSS